MTDIVQVALITGLAAGIPATLAAVLGFINGRGIERGNRKSDEIHTMVNGTNKALEARLHTATTEGAHSQGQLDERDRTEARSDAAKPPPG